jgi:hypothetical protein
METIFDAEINVSAGRLVTAEHAEFAKAQRKIFTTEDTEDHRGF